MKAWVDQGPCGIKALDISFIYEAYNLQNKVLVITLKQLSVVIKLARSVSSFLYFSRYMDCIFLIHIRIWLCPVTFSFLFVCSFIFYTIPSFYDFYSPKQFYNRSETRQHLRNFPLEFLVTLLLYFL